MKRSTATCSRAAGSWAQITILAVWTLFSAAAALADDSPASIATLRASMDAEFEAADDAMRQRWDALSRTDVVGAALQDNAIAEHRARYFELKRRLQSLGEAGAHASLTDRDHFSPSSVAPTAAQEASPLSSVNTSETDPRPNWDMYRSHAASAQMQHPPATGGSDANQGLSPAKPFLVYRSPHQAEMPQGRPEGAKFMAMKSQH